MHSTTCMHILNIRKNGKTNTILSNKCSILPNSLKINITMTKCNFLINI